MSFINDFLSGKWKWFYGKEFRDSGLMGKNDVKLLDEGWKKKMMMWGGEEKKGHRFDGGWKKKIKLGGGRGEEEITPQAALFVFGDSLFDPENNNYINTTSEFQANWRPYGESYFKYPTGRFCDGSLIPNFIAERANLPLIPSYFQIDKQHFVHGVNFASGGAGCLAETHRVFVIDLNTQLKYFKNVVEILKKKVGATEPKQILSNAVYIFSAGGDDYLAPFSTNSTIPYPEREYLQMIMGNLISVLKRRSQTWSKCIIRLSQKFSSNWRSNCLDLSIHYSKVFAEGIDNPTKYGFKTSKTACCGTGAFRGIYSCGGKRKVKKYELCKNVKDYLFFDSFHPTELAYHQYTELL